jgi:hypothetical protein
MKHFWLSVCGMTVATLTGGLWAIAQEPASARPGFSATPAPVTAVPVPGRSPESQQPYAPSSGLTPPIGIEVPVRDIEAGITKKERELFIETMSIVAKYKVAKDAGAQADIQKELTKSVEAQFELRQAVRARELKELEEQLNRLRSIQEQRAAEKDRIVQDRVQQLLREASGLGWGTEPGGPQAGLNQFTPMTYERRSR